VICAECNSLLKDIFMASSKHHEAVTRLAALAGARESHIFVEMLNHCRTRARRYRHVLNALRVHQAGYGCLKNMRPETSHVLKKESQMETSDSQPGAKRYHVVSV
jgi:hypothetical protein